MKRKANITAVLACILWGGLFGIGRGLVDHIYEQGSGVFPAADQIDGYIVFPLMVVTLVGGCAWIANAFQRWFTALGTISVIAVIALLPFLIGYGGGV